MALTGEAKKEYQREYMRDYMKTRRVKTSLRPVKTQEEVLRPSGKTSPNQDKLKALRKLMKVAVTSEEYIELIPFYNPRVHKAGDRVRMKDFRGKVIEVVVPELDGDGHPVPM